VSYIFFRVESIGTEFPSRYHRKTRFTAWDKHQVCLSCLVLPASTFSTFPALSMFDNA
jgi:hypothetical protein